jgi:hypothetical protein
MRKGKTPRGFFRIWIALLALAAPAFAGEEALWLATGETGPAIRMYLPDASGKLTEVVSPFEDPAAQDFEAIAKSAETLGKLFLEAGENVYVSKVTDDLVAVDLFDATGAPTVRLEIDTLRAEGIQSNEKAGITVHVDRDGDHWSVVICLKASDDCYICIQINKHGKDRPVELHISIRCGSIDHRFHCENILRPWRCRWLW